MGGWLTRYGPYALIGLGWTLFSVVIPTASGPADVVPAQLAAPSPAAVAGAPTTPLLIGSPRQPAPPVAEPITPPALPTAAPPAAPAAPASAPTADPTVAPTKTELPPSSRIVIPRIRLDTSVVSVGVLPNGEMETASYAVGRLDLGVDAGDAGNVVLAGHNDVLGEVFRRLPELVPGDEFELFRGSTAFRYRVEGKTIVREQGATETQRRENARWMEPTDEPVATLISCYPYRVDTHRIIVRARLVA
ncbi:MAG TPA: sortase [Chloroflexota bacterium]|nr:sortase [Chloroflexota bacterium]